MKRLVTKLSLYFEVAYIYFYKLEMLLFYVLCKLDFPRQREIRELGKSIAMVLNLFEPKEKTLIISCSHNLKTCRKKSINQLFQLKVSSDGILIKTKNLNSIFMSKTLPKFPNNDSITLKSTPVITLTSRVTINDTFTSDS